MLEPFIPFLTEEQKSFKERFSTESFIASHHLIVLQGEIGSGKSTLLHVCHQAATSCTKTLLMHRPLASKQAFIEALYAFTETPLDTTQDEIALLERLTRIENHHDFLIFIDACELMDYNQMKVIAWLHHHETFKFVLCMRSSEFEKKFYRDTLLLNPSFIFTCHPLNTNEVSDFIECVSRQEGMSPMQPFSSRLLEAIMDYTKGNVKALHTFMHTLFYCLNEHKRLNTPPKALSSMFLAKIALSLRLINELTYKKTYLKQIFYTYVQRIGTTVETVSVGFVCFLIAINALQVYATNQQTPLHQPIPIVVLEETSNPTAFVSDTLAKVPYETLILKVTPPSTTHLKVKKGS